MYRAPLPDAVNSLGSMGGTQGTYGTGPKPAGEQTQNNNSFTNSIYALKDGDKNQLINQSEAKSDIDTSRKNFNLLNGQQIIDRVADFASNKIGTKSASAFVENLYTQFTSGFNVRSDKIDVSENENIEAVQNQLNNATQEAIQQELASVNKNVQQAYESAITELITEMQKQQSESSQTEAPQQQPEYNMQFSGIHNKPTNHDGTRIKGAGLEFRNGDKKIGFEVESKDSAKIYGQTGNISGYAKIDLNPGYTTTAEGGKFGKNYVEIGATINLNGGRHNKPKHKSV